MIMAKMTKAQARKRLKEAADKCSKVLTWTPNNISDHLSSAEFKKLMTIRTQLINMGQKLK